MRIVQTSLGWMDMDHVLRVTPVEVVPQGTGSYLQCFVYVMMRDEPFTLSSEWIDSTIGVFGSPEAADFHEKLKTFLLAWRN